MLTVYYDGACGLCSKEINHYQTLRAKAPFAWIDLTQDPGSFTAQGYKLTDGLRRLHAQEEDDTMHVGVDAFIAIWKQLPRWWLLAKLVSLPGIYHLARFTYHRFADWRFKRLTHCQLAAKEESVKP